MTLITAARRRPDRHPQPAVRVSIRGRLFALVAVAMLPSLVLMAHSAVVQRQTLLERHDDQLAALVASKSLEHTLVFERVRQLLVTLSNATEVSGGAGCGRLLSTIVRENTIYANVGVADAAGDVRCSGVPLAKPVNLADRAYFQRALATGGFAAGGYQVGRVTGIRSLNFAVPLRSASGQTTGVVYAALDLHRLNEVMARTPLPEQGTITVVDDTGTIVVRVPEPERWVGQTHPEAPLVEALEARTSGVVDAPGLDGVTRRYVFASMEPTLAPGLTLAVGQPVDVSLREADASAALAFALAAFAAAVALGAAAAIAPRLVIGHVQQLVDGESDRATHDALTGVRNRRYLDEAGRSVFAASRRDARRLGVILFDLDHFGRLNKTAGHPAGDAVLRAFGSILRERFRRTDIVARYGGEEFAVVMEGAGAGDVARAAESVRRLLESTTVEGTDLRVTVSAGCASANLDDASLDDVIGRADAALRLAKRRGRNNVGRA